MAWQIAAMVGGQVLSGIMGGNAQKRAANAAAAAQQEGTRLGIEEQRRQFNISRQILEPYVNAGMVGLFGMPPGGLTNEQVYGGQGGFGSGSSAFGVNPNRTALADKFGVNAGELPEAVAFANDPGARPNVPTGRLRGPDAERLRNWENKNRAFQSYQAYQDELAGLGITPDMARRIKEEEMNMFNEYDVDPVTGEPVSSTGGGFGAGAGGEEGTPYTPGGLMGFAQAGQETLPIMQQFAQTGSDALTGQRALAGLDGAEAQTQAIDMVRNLPEYEYLIGEGEEALLQNASATGGVRGGRTQSALSELRPGILTDLINRRYSRLGGLAGAGGNAAAQLTSSGQNAFQNIYNTGASAAAGTATNAMNTGTNVANLMQTGATGQANSALASGRAMANMYSGIGNAIGTGMGWSFAKDNPGLFM